MSGTRKPLILIAEDDPADRGLIERALADTSVEVQIVRDGVEIVEHMASSLREGGTAQRPDLIILDLNMPRLDGKAVLEQLKKHSLAKQIPVVMFSSSNRDGDIKDCYRLGCSSYVVKPTDLDPFMTSLNLIVMYWMKLVELPFERARA
jgi:CheY-like chemotaxis protein